MPPCYGHPIYRWYIATSVRVTRVEAVVTDAFDRLDDVSALRRATHEVEDLLAAQEESVAPSEGETLDTLVIDLFRTYVDALNAAVAGGFGEVKRRGNEAGDLGERIAAADTELAAVCESAARENPGRAILRLTWRPLRGQDVAAGEGRVIGLAAVVGRVQGFQEAPQMGPRRHGDLDPVDALQADAAGEGSRSGDEGGKLGRVPRLTSNRQHQQVLRSNCEIHHRSRPRACPMPARFASQALQHYPAA